MAMQSNRNGYASARAHGRARALAGVVAGCVLCLSGCFATQQAKEAIETIEPGMTKVQVTEVLGHPARRHAREGREAWEYCLVGFGANDYVVVFFDEVGVSSREGGATIDWGLCRKRFQDFKWPEDGAATGPDQA